MGRGGVLTWGGGRNMAEHSGPENLKNVQAKNLVKSNKSKIFFIKLNFC